MLTNTTEDYLEEVILDFMRLTRPFTSVDVANIAKNAGFYARNRDVANWLRRNAITIAHDGGHLYNQTLIQVDSKMEGSTLAYLYHHMNFDPDSYLDRDQNPQPYPKPDDDPTAVLGVIITTPVDTSSTTTAAPSAKTKQGHDTWRNQRRGPDGRWI